MPSEKFAGRHIGLQILPRPLGKPRSELRQKPVEVGKKAVEIELVPISDLSQSLLGSRRAAVASSDLVRGKHPSRGGVQRQRCVDGHLGVELCLHVVAIVRS